MKESLSRGSFFAIFYRYTFLSGKIVDMELTERGHDKKFFFPLLLLVALFVVGAYFIMTGS